MSQQTVASRVYSVIRTQERDVSITPLCEIEALILSVVTLAQGNSAYKRVALDITSLFPLRKNICKTHKQEVARCINYDYLSHYQLISKKHRFILVAFKFATTILQPPHREKTSHSVLNKNTQKNLGLNKASTCRFKAAREAYF